MSDSIWITLILFGGALYLAKLWRDDFKAETSGNPVDRPLPGATPAPFIALAIGIVGALLLVLVETAGEIALDVSSQQTDIAAVALLSMLGAGILEEIIFRGYLVVPNKGRAILITSIMGFSLLFALAHYQYFLEVKKVDDMTEITLLLNAKSAWSLLLLFLNSLWFYAIRFFKWNPRHSLLPCFAAHIASNMAVFLVKLAQGHVTSWL